MFRGKQVPPLLDPQMRRLGRVKVSWEMLESFPDLVREALADVLILDAWLDPADRVITYTGASEHFAESCEGDVIRVYTVEVNSDGRVRFRI
jgi:hypothetical protein